MNASATGFALVVTFLLDHGAQVNTLDADGYSPLSFAGFFPKLYRAYDLRFVYAAPKLEPVTSRRVWDPSSPALSDPRAQDYAARIGTE